MWSGLFGEQSVDAPPSVQPQPDPSGLQDSDDLQHVLSCDRH